MERTTMLERGDRVTTIRIRNLERDPYDHPACITMAGMKGVRWVIEMRRGRPIDTVAFPHRMKAAVEHNTFDRLAEIRCPTLVEPVKETLRISGWVVKASPIVPPGPEITWSTPAGSPAA